MPATETTYLTTALLRRRYGGCSEMTLWRWTKDIGFPQPDLVINRVKYWRPETLDAWDGNQAKTASQKRGVSQC